MSRINLKDALDRYVELLSRIRLLSAPDIKDLKGADEYRDCLVRNFIEIGEMSEDVRSLLDEAIYPLLDSDKPLTEEQETALNEFSRALVNTTTMNYLDPILCYRIAGRLLRDAEKKGDDRVLIRALDKFVDSSYIVMHLAFRLRPCSDIGYEYREKGLEAAKKLLEYLDEDAFCGLQDDESKELVLINSRYINALEYHATPMEPDERKEMLSYLYNALELEKKDFYKKALPNYSWERHRFRTYQYLISCTEMNNKCGFSKEELAELYKVYLKLKEMWETDEGGCHALCPQNTVDLYGARLSYLNGLMSAEDYKVELRRIYESADEQDFDLHGIISNLFVLDEYLLVVKETGANDEDCKCLARYYRRLTAYLCRMPKEGSIIFACNIMPDIIKDYVDIPDFTFISFCINLILAIHPPTYVHTMTMTSIADCLTTHLLEKRPELFEDFEHSFALDYATRNALAHDVGKLFVLEYIMMYGRNLFDEEFLMIKKHPDIGAYVLKEHESSRQYAELAAGHHFRFDELEEKAAAGLFDKKAIPFIGVATCADSLDAATDSVGRSYKRGKTLETVISELKEGSGKFYAPYVVELFKDPQVIGDVRSILEGGREEYYHKAYEMLVELSENVD